MCSISEKVNLKNLMPQRKAIKDFSSFFYAFSDDTTLRVIILLIIKPLCHGDYLHSLRYMMLFPFPH